MTIQANQGFGVSIFGATSAGGGSTSPGGSNGQIQYNNAGAFGGLDLSYLSSTLRVGAADAASPVAQTLQVQSVVAGTTNTAGANFTIKGSAGTGTGAGGSIIFQVSPAGSSGTAQNAYATALTIASDRTVTAATTINAGTFANSGGQGITATAAQLGLFNTGLFGWTNNAGSAGALDTILARDAANTLALRNGTTAQTFRVYNLAGAAPATDYDFGTFDFSTTANVLTIGTKNGGAYATARNMQFIIGGTTKLDYGITSAGNWAFTSSVFAGVTSYIGWSGRSLIRATTDGNILFVNSTASDFSLLQFGGTTSSFPALKRSSATLAVRLADDSADAGITCSYVKTASTTVASLPSASTAGAGARSFVTDANATTFLSTVAGGGGNKVPVVSDGTNWLIG